MWDISKGILSYYWCKKNVGINGEGLDLRNAPNVEIN